MAQVVANNQRHEAEKNMQLALERQGRDLVEIRKQVNLWTNNVSSKEAYACWAQQQANPNLSEVPITQISDIMRTNVEKGRPLFHRFLKSDYGASSSSQVDPEEKNEERKLEEQKGRKLEHSARAPTPSRGDSRLDVQSSNPGVAHPRLGVDTNA
ncbi:hypothetical protein PIB30_092498 [Stylosanthes scabra]|uniref:Uncharacterized protein n=1 Tax=Stylosanthes scabra TaxID=79078 RepID=A0ABU6RVE5_9FABA|nr:hypothetical protein [Stylosanthes scabra]